MQVLQSNLTNKAPIRGSQLDCTTAVTCDDGMLVAQQSSVVRLPNLLPDAPQTLKPCMVSLLVLEMLAALYHVVLKDPRDPKPT